MISECISVLRFAERDRCISAFGCRGGKLGYFLVSRSTTAGNYIILFYNLHLQRHSINHHSMESKSSPSLARRTKQKDRDKDEERKKKDKKERRERDRERERDRDRDEKKRERKKKAEKEKLRERGERKGHGKTGRRERPRHDEAKKKKRGERSEVSRKDFEKLKVLGRGDVGKVYLVRHKDKRKLFAMKVLDKSEMITRNKVRNQSNLCVCDAAFALLPIFAYALHCPTGQEGPHGKRDLGHVQPSLHRHAALLVPDEEQPLLHHGLLCGRRVLQDAATPAWQMPYGYEHFYQFIN